MSATLRKRTERHEVHYEFDVEGYPVITDRTGFKTKNPSLLPFAVYLDYRASAEGWRVTARVYGSSPHSLLNGWADYWSGNADAWPGWLHEMAEEYLPGYERSAAV